MTNDHRFLSNTSSVHVFVSQYWHNEDAVEYSSTEIQSKQQPVPFVQTDAGRSLSKRPKQKNDCTVRAYATANNLDYDIAYDYLKSFGRKSHQGMDFNRFAKAHQQLMQRITFPAVKGRKRMNVAAFCEQYNKGVFIIKPARHVLAIIDGVAYDDVNVDADRCVYCAYKIQHS